MILVHPQDELLPLRWKELGFHLLGHVQTCGSVKYRFARDIGGKWCVILRSSSDGGLTVSQWFDAHSEADRWLQKRIKP